MQAEAANKAAASETASAPGPRSAHFLAILGSAAAAFAIGMLSSFLGGSLGKGVDEGKSAPPPPAASALPTTTAPDLARGDDYLRIGRFDRAAACYGDALTEGGPALWLRVGMCREGLGKEEEALAAYHRVLSAPACPETAWAVVGLARVHLRRGRPKESSALLGRMLLREKDLEHRPELLAEVHGWAVLAESATVLAEARTSRSGYSLSWPLVDGQAYLDEEAAPRKKSVETGEKIVAADPKKSDPNPLLLQARMPPAALTDLLERLALMDSRKLRWTSQAREIASLRRFSLDVGAHRLNDLLEAVAAAGDLVCLPEKAEVVVATAEELEPARLSRSLRDRAIRSHQRFIVQHPDHGFVPLVQLQLSRMHRGEAEGEEALVWLQRASRSRSVWAVDAALEMGLYFQARGRTTDALDAFHRAVDQGPTHPRAGQAWYRIGLVYLDSGEHAKAIAALGHAETLARDPAVRVRTALALAAGHLLDHRPEAAIKILVRHRPGLQSGEGRTWGAFLAAFARLRCGPDDAENGRGLQDLVDALLGLPEDGPLGPLGGLLHGMALAEMEMWSSAAARFELVRKKSSEGSAQEIDLRLGEAYLRMGRADDAEKTLTEVANQPGRWRAQAEFLLLDCARHRGDWRLCIERGRSLLTRPGSVPPADILRRMGHAYEKCGRLDQAARCFAGNWPEPE